MANRGEDITDRRFNEAFVAMALWMIERAANTGERCPSNERIAHQWGLKSMSSGARAVMVLEKRGLIRVSRASCSRIVTIAATGKSTAGKVAKLRIYGPGTRPKAAPAATRTSARPKSAGHVGGPPIDASQFVSRDPCPRCGTRADIGCRHDNQPVQQRADQLTNSSSVDHNGRSV